MSPSEARRCPDCGGQMPLTLEHRASAAGCETWSRDWTCDACAATTVEVHVDEGDVEFLPIGPAAPGQVP